jgi:hypothetical protein
MPTHHQIVGIQDTVGTRLKFVVVTARNKSGGDAPDSACLATQLSRLSLLSNAIIETFSA